VLLGQSGSDAVTAAIKTATLATGRHAFVVFDGGYHGLGYAPLPACGYQKGFRRPFEPQLNSSVHHAPFPGLRHASMDASLSFVEELLREYAVAAVLVEPIVGRGGCVVPPDGFLTELCALAHEHGTLVIADEIWTGMGRTGRFLRSEDDSGGADIVCLGKGLGGGLPISACIAPSAIMASWASSGEVVHTSTHAGAPLGCAAALAVLEVVQSEGLAERAQAVGARVLRHFREVLEEVAAVHEVRGAGLMIGIELSDAATAQGCLAGMLARGYLLLSGGIEGNVLTLTPALTIDEQALFDAALALRDVLSAAPPAR
jgi:4-aminobutyrate aminotransferase/(S)-3-amino-2-methylpropionate transaminase